MHNLSFSEYRKEDYFNARAIGRVPYTSTPGEGDILGWLDEGDYVEVDKYGGPLDCYFHLKGKGWVPFGQVKFTSDTAKNTYHPKARKGLQ